MQGTECGFWCIHPFIYFFCNCLCSYLWECAGHTRRHFDTHSPPSSPSIREHRIRSLTLLCNKNATLRISRLRLTINLWQNRGLLNRIHKTKKGLIGKWGVWGGLPQKLIIRAAPSQLVINKLGPVEPSPWECVCPCVCVCFQLKAVKLRDLACRNLITRILGGKEDRVPSMCQHILQLCVCVFGDDVCSYSFMQV